MIRSVVVVRFKERTPEDQIEAIGTAMRALRFPGMRDWRIVRDLGLRDGNAPYAIVSEFDDEEAYRRYDTDPEHGRVRRELLAPIAEHVERIQYRV